MFHGIKFVENATSLIAANQVSSGLTVAIGTASKNFNATHLIYNLSDYNKFFGNNGTLYEVAQVFFSLYNVAPTVFINVLDKNKHYTEKVIEIESSRQFKLIGQVDTDTLKITTGAHIDPNIFESDTDFEVRTDEVEDLDEGTTTEVITLHILNGDKIVDNKIKISYRTLSTALGGTPVESEVTLTGLIYELPSDTVIESVTVQSGGVDNLSDIDFEFNGDENEIEIKLAENASLIDDKIKVYYNEVDPSKVGAADIIAALDKIDTVFSKFNLVPGIIIAPKFSENNEVAAAISAKAQSINAIAINDIDAADYAAAIEYKNTHGLSNANLITCYPKVTLGGVVYYLSTHLAALMNVVDSENGDIPYVSPSNKSLQIDGAIANGEEIYLNQSQADLLNGAGIVTAFSFSGWKAWGNMTSIYPSSNDVKDIFISTRRMINWIKTYLITNYFSNLDIPISPRAIESMLQSINIWLGSLTARQILLGGECTFDEANNPTTDLISGKVTLNIKYASPVPMQTIEFSIEYAPDYLSNLFS